MSSSSKSSASKRLISSSSELDKLFSMINSTETKHRAALDSTAEALSEPLNFMASKNTSVISERFSAQIASLQSLEQSSEDYISSMQNKMMATHEENKQKVDFINNLNHHGVKLKEYLRYTQENAGFVNQQHLGVIENLKRNSLQKVGQKAEDIRQKIEKLQEALETYETITETIITREGDGRVVSTGLPNLGDISNLHGLPDEEISIAKKNTDLDSDCLVIEYRNLDRQNPDSVSILSLRIYNEAIIVNKMSPRLPDYYRYIQYLSTFKDIKSVIISVRNMFIDYYNSLGPN